MAKARPIPGLAAGVSFSTGAAAAIEARTREVFAHAEDVLDGGQAERVHDMRVATRRLRAVLEIFAPCFPRKRHKRLLREVKRLADVLGERRDPDVAIERLLELRETLEAADRSGVDELIARQREAQRAGDRRLAAALAAASEGALERQLLELAEKARP
jgi:CHAD domain-containing protein